MWRMKTSLFTASFVGLTIAAASSVKSFGEEPEDNCSPAKQLVKAAQAFYDDQPQLTNIIDPVLTVGLRGVNGYPDPISLTYKFEGFEYELSIDEGQLKGLDAATSWSTEGVLCSNYADGPLEYSDKNALNLSVSFGFPFRRDDGQFSIKDLNEGAKDGSKIIKSLAPKGLGFAAPSLKSIVVIPADETNDMPVLVFSKDGKPKTVPTSQYGKTQYVRLKDIKSSKVDVLNIQGPYSLAAFFKIDPDEIAQRETARLAEIEQEKN